jgi:hypothetical protein
MTEERQPANAVLLNLAMDNAMRILSMPLPEPNDAKHTRCRAENFLASVRAPPSQPKIEASSASRH